MFFLLILILPFFVSKVESSTSTNTLYAHAETTTIGGVNYYLYKLSSADGPGITLSQSIASTGRKLAGKFVYQLTGVSSIPVSTWIIYYRAYTGGGTVHCDVDILIRKSDGTIRETKATNVANSANLGTAYNTVSGTYSWTAYTVVDQTDYLEIDYYFEVTVKASGKSAYLRIDDNTLAIADQTKIANVMFTYPNQAPVASFTYSPAEPLAEEIVSFNASASYDPDGSITSYQWDFGDGNVTTVTDPVITHVYAECGNYTVTLTVTDNEGVASSASQTITVINPSLLRLWADVSSYVGSHPDAWILESWVVSSNVSAGGSVSFNLYIDAINSPSCKAKPTYDVYLAVAVNDTAQVASITIGSTTITTFTYGQVTWPDIAGGGTLPTHGVYPTWYALAPFGDVASNYGYYTTPGDPYGPYYAFRAYIPVTITTSTIMNTGFKVHFDAQGVLVRGSTKTGDRNTNPFSHDLTFLGSLYIPINHPPVAYDQSVTTAEDTPKGITLTASDSDNDPLTYFIVTDPSYGSLSGSPPSVTYTPDPNYYGSDNFTFRAYDGKAYSNIATVSITVTPVNDPPTAPTVDVTPNLPLTTDDLVCTITTPSIDPEGDPITYIYAWYKNDVLQPAYTINTVSASATTVGDVWKCVVTPYDGTDYGPTDENQVTIQNSPPLLSYIGPKSVNEGTMLSFTATASDPDVPPQTLTFSLGLGAPPSASITSGGYFTWTPTEAQGPGVYNINITVSDGIAIDYEVITVTVNEVNLPPVLDPIGPKTVNELATLSFTATVSDPDLPAQTLTFSLGTGAPAGASITSGGVFSWMPSEAQGLGTYTIRIIVSDGLLEDYEDIVVTVNEVNVAPVLDSIGPKSVNEGNMLSFTATATDTDIPAQTLTFSLGSGAPSGASITGGGAFSWIPTEAQGPSSYVICIIVSDGIAQDYEDITVTVNEVNQPPVLSPIGDKTVSEGALLQFSVTASDPDLPAQTLTYSASNLPPGATFNPSTRVFSWTPTSGQAGVYSGVHFEVTDGVLTDSEDITITVLRPPAPVGGYSISLTQQTPTSHIAAYTMLIALFCAVLILTKRKRK
jgi:PKD repeat protein